MMAKQAFVDKLPGEGRGIEAGFRLSDLYIEHMEYAKHHAQYIPMVTHLPLIMPLELAAKSNLSSLPFLSSYPLSSFLPISLVLSSTIDITHTTWISFLLDLHMPLPS